MDYKKKISKLIKEYVDLDSEKIYELIEIPPKAEMGDYSFPCFQLAKIMGKAPNIISGELADLINKEGFEKVEPLGPYVNFFIDKGIFSKNIIEKILEERDNYGASNIGEGKNVCIEYSSPNIAKPLQVGNLFTIAIGNALCNMYKREGYNVIAINHLGDWEVQIENQALLKEFKRVYDILGVNFDSYCGETFYRDKVEEVAQELKDKNLLVKSNQVQVVMLEKYNMPPCMVLNEGEEYVYSTIDLAAAIYRKKMYDFYKSIYVIGHYKEIHFKRIFKVLELAGHWWANDCSIAGVGLIKFVDRRINNRNQDIFILDNLIRESIEKSFEIISKRNPELENKEEVAKSIGVGAIIFACLKNSREKDILFDWNEILSFNGESGPYVQYIYAKAKSILERAKEIGTVVDYSKLSSNEEFELVKILDKFKGQILLALDKLEPSMVAKYIINVAKLFNKFYNTHPILDLEDEVLKTTRLKLVEASAQVIKNGLELLGIKVVKNM